jgi:hypothetical protein
MKMKIKLRVLMGCIALISVTLHSCKKELPIVITDNSYRIPDTYSAFENVSHTGQTQRLNQLLEIKNYLKESKDILQIGIETILLESKSLNKLSTLLDVNFSNVVHEILSSKGRVVVTWYP